MSASAGMVSAVGSRLTRLIALRGNSGSGKSSLAAEIGARYGRGIALVGQDNLRRVILRERDIRAGANIGLIDTVARYALNRGFHMIIDGILDVAHHGSMLKPCTAATKRHPVYFLDVPFEDDVAPRDPSSSSRPAARRHRAGRPRSEHAGRDCAASHERRFLADGEQGCHAAIGRRNGKSAALYRLSRQGPTSDEGSTTLTGNDQAAITQQLHGVPEGLVGDFQLPGEVTLRGQPMRDLAGASRVPVRRPVRMHRRRRAYPYPGRFTR
jgi:hypothetical protein